MKMKTAEIKINKTPQKICKYISLNTAEMNIVYIVLYTHKNYLSNKGEKRSILDNRTMLPLCS